MITPSSTSNAPGSDFDSGPLSWVMVEIRETLIRSKNALFDAVEQADDPDARTASLRQAKTYLHQAHGALQIVDVDGVAIITETIEDLFDRIDSGQLTASADIAHTIDHAYRALVEYLEELLLGAAHQPVRLFPYYQALLQARGAERIHPADLFFPNLSIRPKLPNIELTTNGVPDVSLSIDYIELRKRFEQSLLPFLKAGNLPLEGSSSAANDANRMQALVGEVEQAQTNQQSRGFWWVMRGFAEAVAAGQIPNELYVKQLFARINLQIRRLGEGSSNISERLLRDALFFVARVELPSPRLKQIRDAYGLEGLVPADYQEKRYAAVDAEALADARTKLGNAKQLWNRIVAGDMTVADGFEREMAALSQASDKLTAVPLSKLLRELNGISRAAAIARPGDRLGIEMATSLLFVENALNRIAHLPENFTEHAESMTARLLSIVGGEPVDDSTPWLDDMAREAQQRQTISALTGELQSSLRQTEKLLEEYFSKPADVAVLKPIDHILHQISGALSVLDQDDAVRAVAHTRQGIQEFLNTDQLADPNVFESKFQHIARNIGALSFFIETLQFQSDGSKKRFTFDDQTGVFRASPTGRQGTPQSPIAGDDPEPPPPSTPSPSPPRGTGPGASSPESSLPSFKSEADPGIGPMSSLSPSSGSIEIIEPSAIPDFEFPGRIDDAAANLATVEQDLLVHQQESADLAISLNAEPDNVSLHEQLKASLNQVRRDATLIDDPEANGRAAAAIAILETPDFSSSDGMLAEIVTVTSPNSSMMESSTSTSAPAPVPETDEGVDAELLEIFLIEAEEVLEAVNVALPTTRQDPQNQESLTTLRRAFHTLKGSGRMVGLMAFGDGAWGIEQVLNRRLSEPKTAMPDLVALLEMAVEVLSPWVDELQAFGRSDRSGQSLIDAANRVLAGHALQSSERETQAEPPLSESEQAGALGIDEIREGSDADDRQIVVDSGEPITEPYTAQPATGSVIEFPSNLAPDTKRDDSVKTIGTLEISVPLHNIYLAETDELVRLLSNDLDEWRHEPERHVNVSSVHAAHSLGGSSATVGFKPLKEIAQALEFVLQQLSRKPLRLQVSEFDILNFAVERTRFMLRMFALGEMPDHEPAQVGALRELQQTLDARADLPQDDTMSLLDQTQVEVENQNSLESQGGDIETLSELEPDLSHETTTENTIAPVIAASLTNAFVQPGFAPERVTTPEMTIVVKDELDIDLLPVFLEEARDMLPEMGQTLRSWQQSPSDKRLPQALLRLLHTIKGSARMAGAMRLGQHMHEMETRIEQVMHVSPPSLQVLDELLARHDHGLQMFEALQNPGSGSTFTEVAPYQEVDAAVSDVETAQARPSISDQDPVIFRGVTDSRTTSRVGDKVITPSTPIPLVRVRADMLDRLVNQAGEVSIARSRLETEMGTMRQSLGELTENVVRLREQLREVEIQAETQIETQNTARQMNSTEREFDPLEFDRFTRLQELTRMMAESVNDVGSVQQSLARTLDGATEDLSNQARLTRDLQQDLMRVRMVQFASISERLYRVTRQASKEVDKRISLDIRGSSVEIDRSVLEKMAGPFEHLLRNAIVHGIESRAVRQAVGKRDVGELLVEIRQEGNEVVIQFTDDGQGLDLDRIRAKATSTGLLGETSSISDGELTDLIFHPGFSTASEITELAGRGVGMDVVRSEAAALGGRIAIASEKGKGAQFTVHLPLTLAVTQVVLMTTGGKTYAVPSVLVEQVQQLKTHALTVAYNEGAVIWQSQRVPMAYLASLLGEPETTAVAQQYSPLMILKSGNDRIAIHVDEIIGNREVVVKNIGPQLARLTGIAGATVLGSGEIVLILNPVSLAKRAAEDNVRAPRMTPGDIPSDMGAVAEIDGGAAGGRTNGARTVAGLRTHRIVMVVDDSLTVRRVTQRLLSREGYQVVLAKDGVDALEQLQSITPDVMLVDIEMPRMDGFDLTRNIRNDDRTRHIPIIMITSRTASKHRNYAFDLGVNDYLGKPFQEDALLAAISGFVHREVPLVSG